MQIKQFHALNQSAIIDDGFDHMSDLITNHNIKNIPPISGTINDANKLTDLHHDGSFDQNLVTPDNNTKELYDKHKKETDPVEKGLKSVDENYSISNNYTGFSG